MHRLNGVYARWLNDAHGFRGCGHVFCWRYHDEPVEREGHLLEVLRYIVLNPVRAGLCERPGGWPWSSHRAVATGEAVPPFLAVDTVLAHFSPNRNRARAMYVAFVEERRPRPPPAP